MQPTYSIVIPAFNEAATLPATLTAVREAMASVDAAGEVIVVDNNSRDATAAVAEAHGATVVFEAHNQISRARNAGGRAARGEALLFLDADTTLPADVLAAGLDHMTRGDYVGGGAVLRFDRDVPWPARVFLGMWNLYSRTMKYAAGCLIFSTRDAFDAAGGFSEKLYASEEIWYAKAIKRHGKAMGQRFFILTSTPATTSARKADRPWSNAAKVAFIFLFPPAIFFRNLCGFWYAREPETNAST